MSTERTIVVDMDGVLKNFCKSAYETHGRVLTEHEPTEFDFFKQWGMTADEFWAPINAVGPDWWSSLPDYEWTAELIDLVHANGELLIATASSHHWSSAAGKVVALQTLFGDRFRDYDITPRKWKLGMPGRVLIDDNEENCEKFAAAGGQSILFPQPWNLNRDKTADRIAYVIEQLSIAA